MDCYQHLRRLFYVLLWQFLYASNLRGFTLIDKETSYLHFHQWNMDETGTLKFKFKTHNDYGLILYTDNSKTTSYVHSYVSLKLTYGYLEFSVQMGAEDYKSNRRITLGSSLNDLRWHHVEIRRDKTDPRATYITLDKTITKSIVNDGEHDRLDLNSGLFFGGIPSTMDNVVDGSLKLEPRLIGCIEVIQSQPITNNLTDTEPIKTEGAVLGCLNACAKNTCPNGGRCINYFTRFTCDCVGTGYTGRTCEKEADLLSFDGQSWVEVEVPDSLRATTNNEISFRFKTRESNGLLMTAWSKNDYLMIEIKNTIICMSINLGGGYHLFRINEKSFSDGEWHLISLVRHGRDVFFMVDNKHSLNRSTSGQFTKFDLREKLYVGGHPRVDDLYQIQSTSKVNFIGCIQEVYFNDLDIIYKVLHTRSNLFYLHGTKRTNCSVTKPKVVVTRENEENKISESSSPNQKKAPTVSSNSIQVSAGNNKKGSDNKTLSKTSVTWIVVGLVCGTLALIITIVVIVHNVRHRYSGVFLSAHVKEQYHKQIQSDGNGTLLYQPRNGKVVIEPHLV